LNTAVAPDQMPPRTGMPSDLTAFVDALQSVPSGNPTLDAGIDGVLAGRAFAESGPDDLPGRQVDGDGSASGAGAPVRWSEDLMALLRLVPCDHNYSLGERDGVRWAWIQPNDDWTPSAHEMRHDHPRGSGLIVAFTLPLAMAAALVKLRALPGHLFSRTIQGDRGD
jgi:hypothetical protein